MALIPLLKNLDELTIDQYVQIQRDTWPRLHGERTVVDYTLNVLNHASLLGEQIRRDDSRRILDELAETTNWLFGLVAKLNDPKDGWEKLFTVQRGLSQMIWRKYPGVCHHCFLTSFISQKQKVPSQSVDAGRLVKSLQPKCSKCLVEYPGVELRKEAVDQYELLRAQAEQALARYAQKTEGERPIKIADIEKMFARIYSAAIGLSTIEQIGFHLLEEAGEVCKAVIDLYTINPKFNRPQDHSRRLDELGDEIAEVFGWACSCAQKVKEQFVNVESWSESLQIDLVPNDASRRPSDLVSLEPIIWKRYRNVYTKQYGCPYCAKDPRAPKAVCACKTRFAWSNSKSTGTI